VLLAFRVTNHKSLRDEAELSLARSTRMASRTDEAGAASDLPSPVAAIYGANASGKSNLLDALAFMATAVRDSYGRWSIEGPIPITPFGLDEAHVDGPSTFEVELLLEGVRYQYGFSLDREQVLEEWLYAYPKKRRQIWFERDTTADDEFRFGTLLEGQKQILAELTRANALFLSVAGSTGHDQLTPVAVWFERSLLVARPRDEQRRLTEAVLKLAASPRLCEQALDILQYADLGIEGVLIEADGEGMQTSLFDDSDELRSWLLEQLADRMTSPRRRPDGTFMRGSLHDRFSLRLVHGATEGKKVALPFESESRGTNALLAITVPALEMLLRGGTLLVDELDTSMHPNLVREVVRLFTPGPTNPRHAQLVFTSHDTSLLGNLSSDESLLERDQVWLTEKDADGSSRLYPLTDFSPRRQENLERGYLQGRYGAVPFFERDQLDALFASGR
jgi:hypothetical protein